MRDHTSAHAATRPIAPCLGRATGPAGCSCGGVRGGVIVGGVVEPAAVRHLDGGGAVAISSEPVAVGADPLEHPRPGHPVAPGSVGLQAVMKPAQAREVAGPGRAGLRSALRFGVMVVRGDVVDVAAPRGSGAPREHARPVAENDLFADPVRDRVPGCSQVGVQVDDGLDGDFGPRVGTPVPDLLEQEQPLAFFEAAGGTEHGLAVGHRLGVEVGVEDDLTCDREPVVALTRAMTLAEQVERGLGAGEVPEGGLPVGRSRSPRTRVP